jgi:hypothetical protein
MNKQTILIEKTVSGIKKLNNALDTPENQKAKRRLIYYLETLTGFNLDTLYVIYNI